MLQVNCPRTYALSESLPVLNTRGLLPVARVHSAVMTNISGTPAVVRLDTSDCHKKIIQNIPQQINDVMRMNLLETGAKMMTTFLYMNTASPPIHITEERAK